jgi:GNAT superfamily N-acetyltransferase
LAAIDAYLMQTLSLDIASARQGGLHINPEPRRGLPGWRGFVTPALAVSFRDGATISVRPDLQVALRSAMGSDEHAERLDRGAMLRLGRAFHQTLPNGYVLVGDLLVAEKDTFRPDAGRQPASLVEEGDPAGASLRHRFDGAIFGIPGPRGPLMSWAALKRKSETVWEIATATEADYRGRGFARACVSAATAHALEQGRLVAYIHDHDNRSSAFVARSLGFKLYSEIALIDF